MIKSLLVRLAFSLLTLAALSSCILVPVPGDGGRRGGSHDGGGHQRGGHEGYGERRR